MVTHNDLGVEVRGDSELLTAFEVLISRSLFNYFLKRTLKKFWPRYGDYVILLT